MDNELGSMSVWRCEKCGAVVDGKFDICMKCGNIRPMEEVSEAETSPETKADEPAEEAVPEVPVNTASPTRKTETKKKKPFRRFIVFVLITAIAVALMILISSISAHKKAVAYFEAGEYLEAVGEAEKDLFYSDDIMVEAIKKHVLQLCENESYDTALSFLEGYSDHPGVSELTEQIVFEYAGFLREQNSFEDAMEHLGNYASCTGVPDMMEEVLSEYALYSCENGRHEEALETLDSYSHLPGVQELRYQTKLMYVEYLLAEGADSSQDQPGLSEAYFDKALDILKELDPEKQELVHLYDRTYMGFALAAQKGTKTTELKKYLQQVEDIPLAKEYLDAIALIEKKQLYEAAKLLRKTEDKEGAFPLASWGDLISKRGPASGTSIEAAFVRGSVKAALFGTALDFTLEVPGEMKYDVPYRQKLAGGYEVTKDGLAQCTGKDTGKMLVIWEIKEYVSGEVKYYVAWDIMNYLPEEYYPLGPEEAEYIVKIACTASSEGYYNISGQKIPAVREKVTVSCTKATSINSTLFGTESLNGDNAPDQVRVSSVPSIISGGLPDRAELSQLIFDAMKDIAGK